MVLFEQYTPDLVDILTDAIEDTLYDLHTGLPAKVVTFYSDRQMVDVQPLLKQVFLDENDEEKIIDIPKIHNVPILYPAGGGWAITWPMQTDDIVYLTFAERSLDPVLESDGKSTLDPVQARRHDLNDAVCIPGLRPVTMPLGNLTNDDLVIGREDGSNQIVIKADGTIDLGDTPTEAAVLGNLLLTYFTTTLLPQINVPLVVTNALPANPMLPVTAAWAAPPTPPTSSILSTKVKVK